MKTTLTSCSDVVPTLLAKGPTRVRLRMLMTTVAIGDSTVTLATGFMPTEGSDYGEFLLLPGEKMYGIAPTGFPSGASVIVLEYGKP